MFYPWLVPMWPGSAMLHGRRLPWSKPFLQIIDFVISKHNQRERWPLFLSFYRMVPVMTSLDRTLVCINFHVYVRPEKVLIYKNPGLRIYIKEAIFFLWYKGMQHSIPLNQKPYWNLEGVSIHEGKCRKKLRKREGNGKGEWAGKGSSNISSHSAVRWGSFQNCTAPVWHPWISVRKRYESFLFVCFVSVKTDTLDLVKLSAPSSWSPLFIETSLIKPEGSVAPWV